MKVLKLILKNSIRHKLRTALTILGIAVALIAFGILRTVVTAWHAGLEASSTTRLVTRQAVSFIFPLPYSYKNKITDVPGVEEVSYANWFGGVYIDKSEFFSRLAIDAETFFDVYPEYLLTKQQLKNFKSERNACVIGQSIAEKYKLKIGDSMTLEGDIYPGRWDFVVRGIYKPRDKSTDGTQMFFHWDYLNERMKQSAPGRENHIGWYIIKIKNTDQAAAISNEVDSQFKNSADETKTETERAFQSSFISAYSSIFTSMNVMSFVIIGIIMLVLGNTMIMAARERTREYAVLKTLGFSAKHIAALILGESLFISIIGGAVGLLLTFPLVNGISQVIPKGFFPVFEIEPITLIFAVSAAILIGVASALFPIQRALSTKIVDGFRFVG